MTDNFEKLIRNLKSAMHYEFKQIAPGQYFATTYDGCSVGMALVDDKGKSVLIAECVAPDASVHRVYIYMHGEDIYTVRGPNGATELNQQSDSSDLGAAVEKEFARHGIPRAVNGSENLSPAFKIILGDHNVVAMSPC